MAQGVLSCSTTDDYLDDYIEPRRISQHESSGLPLKGPKARRYSLDLLLTFPSLSYYYHRPRTFWIVILQYYGFGEDVHRPRQDVVIQPPNPSSFPPSSYIPLRQPRLGHVLGDVHQPPSNPVEWPDMDSPSPRPPLLQTSPGSLRESIPFEPNPELAFLSDVTKANHSLYRVRCRSRCPACTRRSRLIFAEPPPPPLPHAPHMVVAA